MSVTVLNPLELNELQELHELLGEPDDLVLSAGSGPHCRDGRVERTSTPRYGQKSSSQADKEPLRRGL